MLTLLLQPAALVRFKRTLPFARLYVKRWTHTLHLPPARAEIYDGPHADWLRDVLEQLPRLQCLIVDELPFFDHSSLLTLRHPSQFSNPTGAECQSFGLRLLNAAGCSNATYVGLAEALKHLRSLIYLDLSRTLAAKHRDVLCLLESLVELQVLKIRGLGLQDSEIEVVAKRIGNRVRSLDLRQNHLTDKSVRTLLSRCFKAIRTQNTAGTRVCEDSWSNGSPPYPGQDTLNDYEGEQLDAHLRRRLVSDFADRLAIEDDTQPGITHLYISGNEVTAEGVSGLLRSERLRVLDVGNVLTLLPSYKAPSLTEEVYLPGAEKLVATLRTSVAQALCFLRVHHSIVTADAPPAQLSKGPPELVGDIPSQKSEVCQELDSTQLAELPGDMSHTSELPSDSTRIGVAPAKGPSSLDVSAFAPRRGSALAPEVVDDERPTLNATGSGLGTQHALNDDRLARSYLQAPEANSRARSISQLMEQRKLRNQYHRHWSTFFVPSMLPSLRTLALTDVPEIVHTDQITNRLIHFMEICAGEASLAREEAHLSYECPPGRSKRAFERDHSLSIFGLRRLVLEMADSASQWTKKAAQTWRVQPKSQSSTEDADTEAFWSAAQDDFSFFDDEECGQPAETDWTLSWAGDMIAVAEDGQPRSEPSPKHIKESSIQPELPHINVISALTKFRHDRKSAAMAVSRSGGLGGMDGYWEGEVQVIRPRNTNSIHNSAQDYYGNTYEQGFRYR